MTDVYKQKLQLLFSIDGMFNAFADGAEFPYDNWSDLRDGLTALDLPPENIMFDLMTACSEQRESFAFNELRKYFARFFDAQLAAAANSSKISESYKEGRYGCDREFEQYINFLHDSKAETIEAMVYDKLRKVLQSNPSYYKLITEDSRGWYFEKNWLDGVGGNNNSLITNRVATLKNNADRLEWLYQNLADAVSRRSLNALIKYWLTWDYTDWRNIALYSNDVVDTAVYPFYNDEVFVDCGSYVGDTVAQYVNTVNRDYARVYTYDISGESIRLITQNLASLPNVMVNHKGTGDSNTEMKMFGMKQAFHGNKLSKEDLGVPIDSVRVVRLDDDIKEPVTFLKVDCEGMDKETLRGARGLIQKYHPKIHVDSYHKLADLVDVPWLIREFDHSYSLHLRLVGGVDVPPRFPIPAYMAV